MKAMLISFVLLFSMIVHADPFVQRTFAANIATVEKITISGTPTTGSFKVAYNGVSSTAIQYNADAAAVQTAVRTIPALPNATVTGSVSAGFTVSLPDILGDAQMMTTNSSTLSGILGASVTLSVSKLTTGMTNYNVGPNAWVELAPSMDFGFSKFAAYDSSGQTFILAKGQPGQEIPIAIIPPSIQTQMQITMDANTRLSIKTISGNATSGQLILNFWRQ